MTTDKLTLRLASLSPAKRALLELKLQQGRAGLPGNMTIPRGGNRNSAPLSFAQQRLWFLNQLEPDSCAYNERSALRLDGPLKVDVLRGALNAIVERHEVLRTTYAMTDGGEPVQQIGPARDVDLPIIDISEVAEDQREDEVQKIAAEFRERPFDLSKDMPLRLALIRLSSLSHVLIEVQHHIASDGWSSGVLSRELASFYTSLNEGRPNSLPDLPIQYADYAVWQREWLQGSVLEKQLGYWKGQLKNLPALQLPTDRVRSAVSTNHGAKVFFNLPKALFDRLRLLSNQQGATLFMTLLAAFQMLLHRYAAQDDVVVGSPIAGRMRSETEGLIGFFVNMMVLRTNLAGDPTFKELLARVRETALQAYEHQDLPFEKLVEEINPGRHERQTPLFQVVFAVQNVPRSDLEIPGLTVTPLEINSSSAKFDIFAAFIERRHEMILRVEYATEIFAKPTIERMFGHFQRLLEGIVANPDQKISNFTMLAQAERHQVVDEWNQTHREYPDDKSIQELFEEQVESSPDAVALVFGDQRVSYGELNSRANQLAHFLKKHGVGPNQLVGICMERSVEMVIGLLGILKADGVYVPLDPGYPKERLGFMLEDTHAGVVLTDQASLNSLPPCNARVICLDRDWEEIAKEPLDNPDSQNTADNLAYVIYTSGSTGVPKGVEVRQRSVARLLFGVDYVGLDSAQTFLHLAPISFDAATFEVWGALLHGGKCVLFPGKVPSPRELGEVLKKHRVDTLWLTAALFNTVINEEPQALSEVKQLLIGGEALSVPHVRKGLGLLPNTEIINGYGPTESTTFTCCYRIPRQLGDDLTSIPIGKPIGNTQVYILDPHLNPVPVGVPGELHIGGAGLARGYLNRPELTKEKFIANPFSTDPLSRLYKTGDRARYLPDGNIEFLGRIDNQVKIRGYRIELGEIEAVLGQHPSVREAVVMVREDGPGEKQLVGYVVGNSSGRLTANELRRYLKEKLPEYMVPSVFLLLDQLPLTANGKVDRSALPVAENSRGELEEGYLAPRNVTEQRLAQIWTEVLKVEKVGVHDNFFILGGHSLLAIRLLSLLAKEFEFEVPLRVFFESPTIAGVAKYIDAQDEAQKGMSNAGKRGGWSYLFKLKSGDGKSPVFVFPGGFGGENEALALAQIAHFVGIEYPFYGLRARSSQGSERGHESVEKMAQDFVEEIKSIQPEGPYYLLGHCLGGVVAYEVACQLQDLGEKVDLLGFLDTVRPNKTRYYRFLLWRVIEKMIPNWQFYYRDRFVYHWNQLKALRWRAKFDYIRGRSETLKEVFDLKPAEAVDGEQQARSLRELRDNQSSHIAALLRYRPRQFRGQVFSLVADQMFERKTDPTLGWGEHVSGGVKIYRGTGNHDSFIRDHTQTVGTLIRDWLKLIENGKMNGRPD